MVIMFLEKYVLNVVIIVITVSLFLSVKSAQLVSLYHPQEDVYNAHQDVRVVKEIILESAFFLVVKDSMSNQDSVKDVLMVVQVVVLRYVMNVFMVINCLIIFVLGFVSSLA